MAPAPRRTAVTRTVSVAALAGHDGLDTRVAHCDVCQVSAIAYDDVKSMEEERKTGCEGGNALRNAGLLLGCFEQKLREKVKKASETQRDWRAQ
jgi:hypothetical protein